MLALSLGVAGLVESVSALDHKVVAVGANVVASPGGPKENNVIEVDNSPSIAVAPQHPAHLVITYRVDRPDFSAGLRWSDDAGATWTSTALPLPPGKNKPYAPDIAFASDGRLFILYSNLAGAGNSPDNLWLASSADGGRTVTEPVRITGALAFQSRLAVGPTGEIYVTWLQAYQVGTLRVSGPPPTIVATRSTDGHTFTSPARLSDPGRTRVGAASPVVDAAGRLVVLYEDFKGDARDFQNLEGPPWDRPFALVATTSTDGARSFTAGVDVDTDVVPTHRFLVFTPESPSLVAAPGHLYAVWSDGRNGDEDVFLRRSDDGGRSWGGQKPPVRVNVNRLHDGTSQSLPRAAVAADGRVDVLLLDRRRDRANVMVDAYLASSSDAGRSFTNRRISAQPFDSRIGARAAPALPVDFGSRLGLTSGPTTTFAAWTDTHLGTPATGRQDIMVANVRHGLRTPDPGRLKATGVLLSLGVLVIFAWWFTGTGRRPAQVAQTDRA